MFYLGRSDIEFMSVLFNNNTNNNNNIYLLQLVFHPVAVVGKLVEKQERHS